jgi:SHS2 domain-containing protein
MTADLNNRQGFEILEHTADLGFRARAENLSGLFEAAAAALMAIVMDSAKASPVKSVTISATGDSRESLLVNWLNEVLYCLDGERLAIAQCKVRELSDMRVTAEIAGEPRDPERHEPRMVVKGVTYHQLKIQQDDRGWCCEVYLDV